jgi:phage-related protein
MNIHKYKTSGGKDIILNYLDKLPNDEKAIGYNIIEELELKGLEVLDILDTRQLKNKLWEIKFYKKNRFMYVIADEDNLYILHLCKKQKGKAEKFELEKAIKRAKELEKIIDKKFL